MCGYCCKALYKWKPFTILKALWGTRGYLYQLLIGIRTTKWRDPVAYMKRLRYKYHNVSSITKTAAAPAWNETAERVGEKRPKSFHYAAVSYLPLLNIYETVGSYSAQHNH